jgi:hypothetical protein
LLEIIREDGQYLWALCPQHNDVKTPNFCINKLEVNGKPKGFSHCFACSYTTQYSLEDVDKWSNIKAEVKTREPKDWDELQRTYERWDLEVRKHLKLSEMWKVNSLPLYSIGWDGAAHTFPMYYPNATISGIRRIFLDGSKCCVDGSKTGLFLPPPMEDNAVVCEGLSDSTVATHLGYFGIGKPSAGYGHGLVRDYLKNINYTGEVIICEDDDDAGTLSAVKLQKVLTDWDTRVVSPTGDLREHYNRYGVEETKKLLRGE